MCGRRRPKGSRNAEEAQAVCRAGRRNDWISNGHGIRFSVSQPIAVSAIVYSSQLSWISQSSGFKRLKTGFRTKDAKNAKKLLKGELVEFVYESLDVTFEELNAKVYPLMQRCCFHPFEKSLRSLRPWREFIQPFRNFNTKQD
jgi:hypothetical protein